MFMWSSCDSVKTWRFTLLKWIYRPGKVGPGEIAPTPRRLLDIDFKVLWYRKMHHQGLTWMKRLNILNLNMLNLTEQPKLFPLLAFLT